MRFLQKQRVRAFIIFLYGCAALQLIRFYTQNTSFYLNMSAYLAGHERLPFQERILPILILKPLSQSAWVRNHLAHGNGVFTLERGPFYLLSLVSLIVAAIYAQRLYEAVSPQHLLRALVFPVFLFCVMWTYVIHSEANFSYPYDLPSLAFFSAGLFYIYRHRFLQLLIVVAIGTFNRETTLFLIAIYALDAATPADADVDNEAGFRMDQLPLIRLALLSATWLAIKLALSHRFAGNDSSEDFLRVFSNLHQLKPRLLPALLNVCGYTLPLVLIFHRFLTPRRFKNYLWVLPLWFAVMFCCGVLVETRIYGELCSLSAVALVLILENFAKAKLAPHTSKATQPRREQISQLTLS